MHDGLKFVLYLTTKQTLLKYRTAKISNSIMYQGYYGGSISGQLRKVLCQRASTQNITGNNIIFMIILNFKRRMAKQESIAVVTGSSTGIGFETSLLLARSGFYTYATMRDTNKRQIIEKIANKENLHTTRILWIHFYLIIIQL